MSYNIPVRNNRLVRIPRHAMMRMAEDDLLMLGQAWEDEANFLMSQQVEAWEAERIKFLRSVVKLYAKEAMACYAVVAARRTGPQQVAEVLGLKRKSMASMASMGAAPE